MNTYENTVSERHFGSQMYCARARARKEITNGFKHSRRLRNITLPTRRFLPPPPVNYFFDDRAFTQRAFSSVTGVPRYYRMLRMTKDDGRYSLTSQSHLSRERWTTEG